MAGLKLSLLSPIFDSLLLNFLFSRRDPISDHFLWRRIGSLYDTSCGILKTGGNATPTAPKTFPQHPSALLRTVIRFPLSSIVVS
jgi:hypothetical protein